MKQTFFLGLIACTQMFCTTKKISPPQLTVSFDSRQHIVIIKWNNKDADVNSFTVQRSEDGHTWADIGFMQLNGAVIDKDYVFIDKKPFQGSNYYRLKVSGTDDELYANAVMVVTTEPGGNGSDWMMYPVPVTTMLNLKYKGKENLKGVVNVIIQMMNGRVITRYRGASSGTAIQIPVDNLGSGVYDVRIVIENEVVWNQRFVK